MSSRLVQRPIYDDALILDDFVPTLGHDDGHGGNMMHPPHGSIKMMMLTMSWSLPPHLHHMSGMRKVNIGDGDALVPLVDIDCLHDIDAPIALPHSYCAFYML